VSISPVVQEETATAFLAPMFLGPVAYQMLGIGYLGIAVARAFSIVFDKSTAQSNLISLGIEVVLGVILVI